MTGVLFDYNLDHLGLGTIDAPEWKIPDRTKAYVARAVAARAGLWGNHGYEAYYAFVWTDEDGQPLDGPTATSCGWSSSRGCLLVADDV